MRDPEGLSKRETLEVLWECAGKERPQRSFEFLDDLWGVETFRVLVYIILGTVNPLRF